jgi:hypothetical protein
MKKVKLGTYDGLMSENDNYFIPTESDWGEQVIFATAAPRNSTAYRKQGLADISSKGKTYVPYISESFIKDCLHTAEEICNQKQFDPKSSETRSKTVEFGRDFGDSDAGNIATANFLSLAKASNGNAAPGLGQAYVIVNTKWTASKGSSPYHAAAVVAVDGNDRITLEVFASTRASKQRKEPGSYRMYTTSGGTGHTFHGFWNPQATYFSDTSVTFAIAPKT